MTQNKAELLLQALWDGGDEDKGKRVAAALERTDAKEALRQIVLTRVLPMVPEFKGRRDECGGPQDALIQFGHLLSEIIKGGAEFPHTVDGLINEIKRRVDESYRD